MSLFGRLFKYRATEGKSPQEDFLTEALAGVLESSFLLRVAFVKECVKELVDCDLETVSVETQKGAGSYGRLDLWLEARECSGERHVVVFENKIWAGEGENQLGRYARYLQDHEEAESRTLIYLTPYASSDFEESENANSPGVEFLELRWFQVFNRMKAWMESPEAEAGSTVLVKELLALMEEWNLTMELKASDLAAAVAHRSSVERKMAQLLYEVKAACQKLPRDPSSKWTSPEHTLNCASPWLGNDRNFYFKFGFDFDREDDVWSVRGLGLPAAYFAVCGDVDQLDWNLVPSDWVPPPEGWNWGDASRVKRLSCLEAKGGSLHEGYSKFFNEALEEALQATRFK